MSAREDPISSTDKPLPPDLKWDDVRELTIEYVSNMLDEFPGDCLPSLNSGDVEALSENSIQAAKHVEPPYDRYAEESLSNH